MTSPTWTPESLGIPNRQNIRLWNDIQQAYAFVEKYARYTISGNLDGFLFELVRRRWNLACTDVYEPPPQATQETASVNWQELIPEVPEGLTQVSIDKLSLSQGFVRRFKEYTAVMQRETLALHPGKLHGYGTDGYGTYIPLHLLWPELKDYWGIYISEIGIMSLAATLYNHLPSSQARLFPEDEAKQIGGLIQIAYQTILRHQLFHFKVEQWALMFELATGRAYYLPYLQDVYLQSIYDPQDTNLEEALANLSILLSKKIQRIEKDIDLYVKGTIASSFLDQQGPNYRNYELNRGVPVIIEQSNRELRYREVVNYLCNQIIRHDLQPKELLIPYYLYPPNNNFLRAENLCPIYLVRNLPYPAGVIA